MAFLKISYDVRNAKDHLFVRSYDYERTLPVAQTIYSLYSFYYYYYYYS